MSVDELDPRTAPDADLASVHELLSRIHRDSNPAEPYRPVSDTTGFLRHPPDTEPRFHWIIREADGDAIGFAQLRIIPDAGRLIELAVDPQHRRRGHGSELLDAVERRARTAGCRTLVGGYATAAGAEFAAARGAADVRRELRSLLSLADLRPQLTPVAGYTTMSWTGAAPDDMVESFARARMAINDAPGEWEDWDAARVRDLERSVALRGRQLRVTVALDAGGVVGFTELRVSRTAGAVAGTEDTAVVREHRGRGLALWMKSEALAGLRSDRPDVSLVSTVNAESNAAILAVNARLGFVRVATETVCVLQLGV
ncbi:MAG TPA: GNAT family N-acetyltransferase [Gaiellales bacterium]|jgi:GNAT superfamily N-acetyltransferase|nr:GNAT family N-acetyltransferase [Gaiellales bacterium]